MSYRLLLSALVGFPTTTSLGAVCCVSAALCADNYENAFQTQRRSGQEWPGE
jgi:hypothetical protein